MARENPHVGTVERERERERKREKRGRKRKEGVREKW